MREVVEGGDDDVGGRALLRLGLARLGEQLLRTLDERREHDEEVGRHEGRDEDVLVRLQDAPHGDRGQARNEAGQNPEREEECHGPVGDQVDAQARDLVQVECAGSMCGDREEAEGSELDHQPVHREAAAANRLVVRLTPLGLLGSPPTPPAPSTSSRSPACAST